MHDNQLKNNLHRFGIPDNFIEHGTRRELLDDLGLNCKNIISVLRKDNVDKLYEH